MHGHGTAVLNHGKVELPEAALRAKNWAEGSELKVVETSEGLLLMEVTQPAERCIDLTFDEILAANRERLGLAPNAPNWRALEGILADDFLDSLEEKQRLREEELEHDRVKFSD